MSIETWKQACGIEKMPSKRATVLEVLEWCERKWVGLRGETLAKHKVRAFGRQELIDESGSCCCVGDSTCPACTRWYEHGFCLRCPLSIVRGKSCWMPQGRPNPWMAWLNNANPEPMIRLIRKAIRQRKEKP